MAIILQVVSFLNFFRSAANYSTITVCDQVKTQDKFIPNCPKILFLKNKISSLRSVFQHKKLLVFWVSNVENPRYFQIQTTKKRSIKTP